MITVHLMPDLFGLRPTRTIETNGAGRNALQAAAPFLLEVFDPSTRVAFSVNGRPLTDEECCMPLPDGCDVVVAPVPGLGLAVIPFIINLAVGLIVGAIVAYAAYLLTPTPRFPGLPSERGEERSPTRAWDRIHSEYRNGFPIPIIAGEHDAGGQVIYVRVTAKGVGNPEVLAAQVAYAEGRCESIGGVTGVNGEANALGSHSTSQASQGTLPANFRINGNKYDPSASPPGMQAWLRMGEIDQTALPGPPFHGVETTIAVNEIFPSPIAGSSSITRTISDTREITALRITMTFPAGLYQNLPGGGIGPVAVFPGAPLTPGIKEVLGWVLKITDPNGVQLAAGVEAEVLATGQKVVLPGELRMPNQPATTAAFAYTIEVQLGPGIVGPLTVQVTDIMASIFASQPTYVVVSGVRQISYLLAEEFSYPRMCYVGFDVEASATLSGSRNTFIARVKGLRVRVFDATIGGGKPSTNRYWELPPAGDPYNGIWSYAPGPNPAWFLAEFLTNQIALGEYITDDDIDWPAFRDWADFCDQDADVGGVMEAFLQFDYVLDDPEEAWDHVLRICNAGRAAPVLKGSKFSVVYQYANAHGRGTNSIAAKQATQLITSGSVEGFSPHYFNPRGRPGVLLAQILNKDKDYAQDIIPVEDPNAGFDDPAELNPLGFTKSTIQLYGVVRPSQAVREMLFTHEANGKIRGQVSFGIGPESLKATIGDVIKVQHDVLRPFSTESFAYRVFATTNTTSITIDRALTLEVAKTYQAVVRDASDAMVTVAITQAAGTYARGDTISVASTTDVVKGAPMAIGETAAVVKEYQIIGISLTEDLRREVKAIEWVPAIHTIPTLAAGFVDLGASGDFHVADENRLLDSIVGIDVADLRVIGLPAGRGRHRIMWTQPENLSQVQARVWLRISGSESWWLLGTATADYWDCDLSPGATYEVAIAMHSRAGAYVGADQGTKLTFTAQEFPHATSPVPSVQGGKVQAQTDQLALEWDPCQFPGLVGYEVRHAGWTGSRLVARLKESRIELPYPPYYDGTVGAGKFFVRAQHENGLLSWRELRIDTADADPYAERSPILDEEPDPAITGTLDGLTSTSKELSLSAGKSVGTWESPEYSLGYDVTGVVLVYCEGRGEDIGLTVGDCTWELGAGEAHWRTVGGRDASPATPGVNVVETVSDWARTSEDVAASTDRFAGSYAGDPGHNHHVRVMVRTALTAGTLSSETYEDAVSFRRSLGKLQVKIQLARSNTEDLQAFADKIRIRVFA